ncbi:PucR family transcriptional regulator [Saccharopolyspora mangrovi]|uniref:Helix-turn-helix domain-containing protein n=1 Tax=Saccharopolyspora mangrovi TaxID=3082379 RepID=A0ABU6ALQ7_9PSEU|nr:helix-turn-helix domain-containing protein [Saccharopolyspora sp. S2-29]MEB3372255.1 helix-turn-helix domain-containing protein [Saccharopolyspora sp. S2-29]
MVADPADLPNVTHALAKAGLDDVPALTERLMSAIFTDNPEWTDYRPVPREDLWEGCRQYLERILQILSGEVDISDRDDDVAAAIGRRRAEQGVPLEVMLRTFRLGGRVVWEALVDQAHRDGADPDAVLGVATSIWRVIDGLSSTLSTFYRSTELERLRRDDQRRHALVEDLLAGRARDVAFAQRTAKELDLPTGGAYLVVVAEMADDGAFALRGHSEALAALHFRSVWQVRADSLVGLIALEHHPAELALDALRPLARARVAVSPKVQGLAEIGLAHQLALTTLGTSPHGAAELVTLEERFPEALLVQSPDLAQRLLETQLGPVLALPVKERDMLLDTLTAWLEENCSTANAAVRLHCHRNTVLNRLHRVTTLIGQPLHGRTAYVSLSLALSTLDLRNDQQS